MKNIISLAECLDESTMEIQPVQITEAKCSGKIKGAGKYKAHLNQNGFASGHVTMEVGASGHVGGWDMYDDKGKWKQGGHTQFRDKADSFLGKNFGGHKIHKIEPLQ